MLGFPLFLVLFFCFVLFFSHITKKNSANLFYQNVKYERVDVMPLMLTLYFAGACTKIWPPSTWTDRGASYRVSTLQLCQDTTDDIPWWINLTIALKRSHTERKEGWFYFTLSNNARHRIRFYDPMIFAYWESASRTREKEEEEKKGCVEMFWRKVVTGRWHPDVWRKVVTGRWHPDVWHKVVTGRGHPDIDVK